MARRGRQHKRIGCWSAALALALAAAVHASGTADSAAALLESGQCSAALQAARNAIERADRVHGVAASAAAALAQFSHIALECRRPDAAGLDEALARELSLRENVSGTDSAAAAQVKLARARRALQLNRIDEAIAQTQALRESPRYAAWPLPLRASVLAQLASLYNLRADARRALENAEAALALARVGSADPALLLAALQEQGFALTRMRQGAKALQPLNEAQQVARARFGPNSRQLADALRFAAYAKRDAGDFGGAIGAFEQAVAIQRAQAEVDERQIALLLLNLAQTLKISGDGDRALARYEEALAIDARAPDPAGRTRPAVLHGLANLYRDRDDNQRALTLYAQAVPLFGATFGEHSVQLAQVLNNYANAQGNLGDYDAAIALYERALGIARERQSADPGDYVPLTNIAMMRVWQGRYAEAESGFRDMLARVSGVSAGSEASALFSQLGLAASLWGQGRLDDAFNAAITAEQMRQTGLRLALSHLGEAHAIGFQEYQRPSLDFVLAIAAASGKSAHLVRAWELSMAARDQVTARFAQRIAAARAARDPKLAAAWQAWRAASAEVARTELQPARDDAARRAAQDAMDHADRDLADAANPFVAAALDAKRSALADLRGVTPPESSLVLFVVVQPHVASDFAKPDAAQGAPDLYALVLPTAGGQPRAIKLGSAAQAAQRIEAWSAALSDPGTALAAVNARGTAVREMLWDPLRTALPGKRVLIVPSGALFRVAWSALPEGNGFLIDRGWSIHVLNHERELLAPALPPMQRLLAIADPAPPLALPQNNACPDTDRLPALPGARREAQELGEFWRSRFAQADALQLLVGENATKARVREASPRADVLHFATHSVGAIGAGCANVATRGFALVGDTPAAEAEAALFVPAALALAPVQQAGSEIDGLLSAEEIAALDLSHVHWAVLAACATAAGATRHYEGLFGLARAFRIAGARTVLMSLWPVDDTATAQWSKALYQARFGRGLDTAAALTYAQRSVLDARRRHGDSQHPYYWAAFVAVGDWR